MSITAMSGRRITVTRRTANIVDTFVAGGIGASVAPDRQPARDGHVEVSVTAGAGTITVNGDVDGSPDSEVLTFTAASTKATLKRFDAGTITSVDYSGGFSGASVTARSVGAGGDRHHNTYTIASAWPCRFDRSRGNWANIVPGSQEVERTRFYVDYNTVWSPREGDAIVDDRTGKEFLVVGDPTQHGGGRLEPHHWEITVRRREQSSTT